MDKIVKIEDLLAGAAPRFFSDTQLQPDPELVAAGWERRFTADALRVEEVIELYSKLGYEVRAEPVRSEEVHDDCTDCHSLIVAKFKTIYTRRRTL
jgi:hypothetical protein